MPCGVRQARKTGDGRAPVLVMLAVARPTKTHSRQPSGGAIMYEPPPTSNYFTVVSRMPSIWQIGFVVAAVCLIAMLVAWDDVLTSADRSRRFVPPARDSAFVRLAPGNRPAACGSHLAVHVHAGSLARTVAPSGVLVQISLEGHRLYLEPRLDATTANASRALGIDPDVVSRWRVAGCGVGDWLHRGPSVQLVYHPTAKWSVAVAPHSITVDYEIDCYLHHLDRFDAELQNVSLHSPYYGHVRGMRPWVLLEHVETQEQCMASSGEELVLPRFKVAQRMRGLAVTVHPLYWARESSPDFEIWLRHVLYAVKPVAVVLYYTADWGWYDLDLLHSDPRVILVPFPSRVIPGHPQNSLEGAATTDFFNRFRHAFEYVLLTDIDEFHIQLPSSILLLQAVRRYKACMPEVDSFKMRALSASWHDASHRRVNVSRTALEHAGSGTYPRSMSKSIHTIEPTDGHWVTPHVNSTPRRSHTSSSRLLARFVIVLALRMLLLPHARRRWFLSMNPRLFTSLSASVAMTILLGMPQRSLVLQCAASYVSLPLLETVHMMYDVLFLAFSAMLISTMDWAVSLLPVHHRTNYASHGEFVASSIVLATVVLLHVAPQLNSTTAMNEHAVGFLAHVRNAANVAGSSQAAVYELRRVAAGSSNSLSG